MAALEAALSERGMASQRLTDPRAPASVPRPRAVVFGETDGGKLADELMGCIALDDVAVVAPITDRHFSRKPLFLVSIPKAGTHLLYELATALGYEAGIECPEFPQGQTWYCVEYSNSHTVAKDFFVDTVRHAPYGNRHHRFMSSPTLFMYRHPLDVLVSEAHYYHRDGKTAFSGWLSQYDFDERIERLCNDNWLLGSLRDRIGGYLPWMDFPNVVPLSFEQLIGTAGGGSDVCQRDLIWSIQLKLQAPGNTDAIAASLFNPHSETFRAGQIGAYRSELRPEAIAGWSQRNADILAQLGYPTDGSLGLPARMDEYLHRPIVYSQVESDRIPVTIEADFLGCNLVRYDNRIYAIPRAAGTVALDRLPAAIRAELPCAGSVSELKSLLLVGRSGLTAVTQALTQLAERVRGNEPHCIDRYWEERIKPAVIEVYHGFNVVAYRGLFFGLRQSLGEIDFSGDMRGVIERFAPEDVVVCATLAELRVEIDGLATAQRTRKESMAGHEQLLARLDALERRFVRVEERLSSQDECIAALRADVASLEARVERVQSGVAAVGQLAERQAAFACRSADLEARMRMLESSWAVRFTRMVTRVMRGRT
ncbi:hypothetical protein WKR88_22255 [Trinickia caryophylli]|uniref:Sulfotransferase family protein n=1 Tax=Trinickia caryophylli TaxID=28094 RepID=A0A1X7CNJ4_TRICW|nr:hypothetical protein [Trinickia caryophylli]PMS11270.1 hypothetical protein C0Z17_15755 [Trinickia caryophylli]TRX20123.1 hypothetical protein FNF07_19315 [Trinickia caryophylli]WQE12526.1 hypothetical protein U0034_03630 [Trinickia caryophylli]SME99982.1 hypothetical protein SAMN06295900_101683 [Trinickia caryophylli]GLU30211.1 hypothetical protein Busp01_00530 [Trinickia caryophylli]